MSSLRYNFVVVLVTFFGMMWFPAPDAKAVPDSVADKAGATTMVITSDQLEVDDTTKVVTFSGDVKAKKDNFIIECERMRVFYQNSIKGNENQSENGNRSKIEKIIASGQVRILRDEGGVATAEKAIYFQDEEKVILTGNPKVEQGRDFVEGERIIIYLSENRSVVQGSEDKTKRVKALIFPEQEGR